MNGNQEKLGLEKNELFEKINEDLNYLHKYPSIENLFSESNPDRINSIRNRLNTTKSKLDSIIRRGTNDQAESATKAQKAIALTLELLEKLEVEKTHQKQ